MPVQVRIDQPQWSYSLNKCQSTVSPIIFRTIGLFLDVPYLGRWNTPFKKNLLKIFLMMWGLIEKNHFVLCKTQLLSQLSSWLSTDVNLECCPVIQSSCRYKKTHWVIRLWDQALYWAIWRCQIKKLQIHLCFIPSVHLLSHVGCSHMLINRLNCHSVPNKIWFSRKTS